MQIKISVIESPYPIDWIWGSWIWLVCFVGLIGWSMWMKLSSNLNIVSPWWVFCGKYCIGSFSAFLFRSRQRPIGNTLKALSSILLEHATLVCFFFSNVLHVYLPVEICNSSFNYIKHRKNYLQIKPQLKSDKQC